MKLPSFLVVVDEQNETRLLVFTFQEQIKTPKIIKLQGISRNPNEFYSFLLFILLLLLTPHGLRDSTSPPSLCRHLHHHFISLFSLMVLIFFEKSKNALKRWENWEKSLISHFVPLSRNRHCREYIASKYPPPNKLVIINNKLDV